MKISKYPVLILATALFCGGILVAGDLPSRVSASDGQSYILNDLGFVYPAVDRLGVENLEEATVSFMPDWSAGTYPGDAECTVEFRDSDNQSVGESTFTLSAPEPAAIDEPNTLSVAVRGTPASVLGSCGAGIYEPGPGYVTNGDALVKPARHPATGEVREGVIELTFILSWQGSSPPGMRQCVAHVSRSDGSSEDIQLNVHIAEKHHPLTIPLSGPLESVDVDETTFTCHEFQ